MSSAAPPPKPWERNRSPASTSSLPAALSAASSTQQAADANSTDASITRPQPARPWEQSNPSTSGIRPPYTSTYGTSTSYGTSPYSSSPYSSYGAAGAMTSPYSSPYNRGMMGTYGGYSSYNRPMYGGAGWMYGSSMYGGAGGMYGSSMYGGGAYGSSMYGGGGMYGSPYAPPGMGPMGQPPFDPNNPIPQPPTTWQHFLGAINGLMTFFGRLSFLVDENAHAVHFFISALLTLLDRAGSLYGELARFILRLLGRRRKGVSKADPAAAAAAAGMVPAGGPPMIEKQLALPAPQQRLGLPAPPSAMGGAGQWENLWGS